MANTRNCFIKSNLRIAMASGWLQRLVRRMEFETRPLLRFCFRNLASLRIEIVACSPHRIPAEQRELPRHSVFALLAMDIMRRAKPIDGIPRGQHLFALHPKFRMLRVIPIVYSLPFGIVIPPLDHIRYTPRPVIMNWRRRIRFEPR